MRGEDHSPVEGRLPPGPGDGGRVVPFSSPSLPSPLAALIRERERLPLNSPEESSRLSIHADLHVLEPEQTKGKCVLQWAVLTPFRRPGSRPPDKGESSSTLKLQLSPQSCGLSRGVCVWGGV